MPTVSIVTAGLVLGYGVNVSYREAKSGAIPTIMCGGTRRVPSADLLKMIGLPIPAELLGLPPTEPAALQHEAA